MNVYSYMLDMISYNKNEDRTRMWTSRSYTGEMPLIAIFVRRANVSALRHGYGYDVPSYAMYVLTLSDDWSLFTSFSRLVDRSRNFLSDLLSTREKDRCDDNSAHVWWYCGWIGMEWNFWVLKRSTDQGEINLISTGLFRDLFNLRNIEGWKLVGEENGYLANGQGQQDNMLWRMRGDKEGYTI